MVVLAWWFVRGFEIECDALGHGDSSKSDGSEVCIDRAGGGV